MKSSVVSFFDSANLGDLLIAKALAEFAKEYGETRRLSYSGDPMRLVDPEEFGGVEGVPLSTLGLRQRLLLTTLGSWLSRVKQIRTPAHRAIEETIDGTDVMLLGGGNMIFDLEACTRSSDRFSYFVDVAGRQAVPTFAISLGIGPFATVRQHRAACRALDRCQWITFRDQRSLDLYGEHGRSEAELAVDPVLLMPPFIERPPEPRGIIACNVIEPRLLGAADRQHRAAIVSDLAFEIREWLAQGYVIELFSTDRADQNVLEDLAARVADPACRVRIITGLGSLLNLYREVDLVIACRMHALIVAYTQGVPIVGLSWQQKVEAFFDLIGCPSRCLPLRDRESGVLQSLASALLTYPQESVATEERKAALVRLVQSNNRIMEQVALSVRSPMDL